MNKKETELQWNLANRESMGFLPKVSSEKSVHASKTLLHGECLPLGAPDVEGWVRYWREVGYLPPAGSLVSVIESSS
jgi:hypothetical protein